MNPRARSRSRSLSHDSATNVSPQVIKFLVINHQQPPANAPTEPRAMRTEDVARGSSSGPALDRSPLHAIQHVRARPRFYMHGIPPAGVRGLGSTRSELGLRPPTNKVIRNTKRERIEARLMALPQGGAALSGQSGMAASLSGPPQGRPKDEFPGPSNSCLPDQAHQAASAQSKAPELQTDTPGDGLPTSTSGGQADMPCIPKSAIPSSGPVGNKTNNRGKHIPQQRRGPARVVRIMQSVENLGGEISLSPLSSPVHNAFPLSHRPATPGPSCPRPHAQSSPGLFVTPNSPVHTRPVPSSPIRSSVAHGKRPRDEAEGLDPDASERIEWERRMAERMRQHEEEMEHSKIMQKRKDEIIEDLVRRIEELEQQRRIDDLMKELDRSDLIENQQNHVDGNLHPHHDAGPHQNQESVEPEHQQEHRLHGPVQPEYRQEHRLQGSVQPEHRQKHRRRHGKQRRRDPSVEPEQPGAQQPEPERRQHAQQSDEGRHSNGQRRRARDSPSPAEPHVVDPVSGDPSAIQNIQELNPVVQSGRKITQKRFKRRVLQHALSGHNPELVFEDADRPIVSEATAFLLRLSQQQVLNKFCKHIKKKEFFDIDHPSRSFMGCWVISADDPSDYRIKMSDQGETHSFPFKRLAIRLWHDEESMYRLLQGKTQQKATSICHNKKCMNPDHIVVEHSKQLGERRKCKKRGHCFGHITTHKDGTVQRRLRCIFPHQPLQ